MESFSLNVTTAKHIDEFMTEQNKHRHKPMTKSQAICYLIANGIEWFNNEKLLWNVSKDEYREHTEKRREAYRQSVLQ